MPAATSSLRLRLAPHVRACESDGQVILLDLRHSRYLGIGRPTSAALAAHVEGWPASAPTSDGQLPSALVGELARQLFSQGLLTDTAWEPQPVPTIEEATASIDLDEAITCQAIGARRVGNFLKSAAIAAWWLHCHSLYSIVLKVAARRERLAGPSADSLDAMRMATASYEKLRPLVFTARERCLHDSLALIGFMATEGLRPRWVVGVKTSPFGAHSWIQSGRTVLNDLHEYVRAFRPILVV